MVRSMKTGDDHCEKAKGLKIIHDAHDNNKRRFYFMNTTQYVDYSLPKFFDHCFI